MNAQYSSRVEENIPIKEERLRLNSISFGSLFGPPLHSLNFAHENNPCTCNDNIFIEKRFPSNFFYFGKDGLLFTFRS